MTRNARRALTELRETYPSLVLEPFVPDRVIVGEARAAHEFYVGYDKGRAVHHVYQALAEQVIRP